MELHVIEANWLEHQATLREIRKVVFIDEQKVSQEEEWDGLDEDSTHLLAVNQIGQYLGCARLLPDGQIGRMAVLAEHRGLGIGAALLSEAIEVAKKQGLERVFLHAQSHAIEFYRKGGFVPYGKEFFEAGISHMAMQMMLPLTFESVLPQASANTSSDTTSKSNISPNIRPQEPADTQPSSPVPFHGHPEALAHLEATIASGKRKIDLLHPTLDQELFEHAPLLEAISKLARSAAQVEVRILIMDSRLIVDRGHQLLELARRLDDKVKIRILPERITHDTSAFACVDQSAYWVLPKWQELEGVKDLHNPVTTARLKTSFEQAWAKSVVDPQLRVLNL